MDIKKLPAAQNSLPVTEGGLLIAVAVILGLAATYLPVVGAVVEFFCAVPFVVLTFRRGIKIGLVALIVTFILLLMFTGPILSARLTLTVNLVGVIFGHCVRFELSTVKTFIATFLSAIGGQIFIVAILAFVMEINFADMELSTLKEAFAESAQVYENLGVEKSVVDEMQLQTSKILELMAYLMPMILILLALLNTVACYLSSKWIFKKLQMKFLPPMPDFAEWRFPVIFLYASAFAIIGMYWGNTREWNLLFTVSINTLIFSMGAGLVQGFSILSFASDRFNVSKFWRRIFFAFILLNGLMTQIVAFIGLFDMLFDYRKKFSN